MKQGDPMSPLLFVLVMEYLSRTLKSISELPDFRFHPMCKATKLNHLIFADDLMVFCKADMQYISMVMEALDHFSEVTELVANRNKSNIFIAGVDAYFEERILEKTGFSIGTLPIRYLGLHLSSKKWRKVECYL